MLNSSNGDEKNSNKEQKKSFANTSGVVITKNGTSQSLNYTERTTTERRITRNKKTNKKSFNSETEKRYLLPRRKPEIRITYGENYSKKRNLFFVVFFPSL